MTCSRTPSISRSTPSFPLTPSSSTPPPHSTAPAPPRLPLIRFDTRQISANIARESGNETTQFDRWHDRELDLYTVTALNTHYKYTQE
ncbi:hypothetical protein SISSUDRAFT_528693 [Sistotremastrum suecicum HHB10207 ss-3]|uniref:Uncharacterized protein n=1 Tax=Sistotremastrum suecicum HHB10207 ss-3 TaxID=1314776 RepID=A0A165XTV0_9AGAM|nr:hypothetical protein SISSUDRAFT_528693 [Sistotremastrum suecicum HHB10207 ss-3]